ncbi:MAG: methyl-accepting chemotaxis protein [Burkholderiales bacterium]
MFSIGKMKVGARLGLGFGIVLLLLTGITFVGATRLSALNDGTQYIVIDQYPKVALSTAIIADVDQIGLATRNSVLATDQDAIKAEMKVLEDAGGRVKDSLEKLEKLTTLPKDKELFKVMVDARTRYVAEQNAFKKLIGEGKKAEATTAMLTTGAAARVAYRKTLNDMAEFQSSLMEKAAKEATESYFGARNLMLGLAGVAILLACGIAFWVTRSITRPLNEAVGVAQKVAAGDLTSTVEVNSKDETGLLLQALKDMNESLKKIVGQVRTSTESISTGSKQIASGNADLSSRTEEQASSLEETASSMEELTSTVKQNAENAKQANQLAAGASDVALKGGQVVGQVVTTMFSINESSKKIVDIISVIDGIAFQTNILALNAAVEAARAGEQGRGFAVVATEVRTLAQRSAAAAKEIKTLIGDSVHKVEDGTKLVDEAGKTMAEIVAAVKRVTDIMAEISAASQEQSSGIEQVNQAVTQMDQTTQQNAALVEEAAAAAESMQEQAQNLVQAVAVFKLAQNEERAAVRTDKPAASQPRADVRQSTPRAKAKPQAAAPVQPAAKPRAHKAIANSGEEAWEEF